MPPYLTRSDDISTVFQPFLQSREQGNLDDSRWETLSFILNNSTRNEVSLRMNDLKLRNIVVATLGLALTVTSFGALQAQSMPTTKKDPGATSSGATTVAPGATQTKPATTAKPVSTGRPVTTTQAKPAGKPAAGKTPAAAGNIVELASSNKNFSKLVAAVKAADLVEAFSGAGPYTLFAPTDAAFAKLPAGTLDKLLKPENKAALQKVLKYHVIAGAVMAADVKTGKVDSAEGSSLNIVASKGSVTVGGAKVLKADNVASNGVIHVIDKVLIPPDLTALK
jgi:uncharacterized surface protein with fasciclin (FAS1) repeats